MSTSNMSLIVFGFPRLLESFKAIALDCGPHHPIGKHLDSACPRPSASSLLVHVIRLDWFSNNKYRGDVMSKVDVIREVGQHIRAHLTVKSCEFLPMEGIFTLHPDSFKYKLSVRKCSALCCFLSMKAERYPRIQMCVCVCLLI